MRVVPGAVAAVFFGTQQRALQRAAPNLLLRQGPVSSRGSRGARVGQHGTTHEKLNTGEGKA